MILSLTESESEKEKKRRPSWLLAKWNLRGGELRGARAVCSAPPGKPRETSEDQVGSRWITIKCLIQVMIDHKICSMGKNMMKKTTSEYPCER